MRSKVNCQNAGTQKHTEAIQIRSKRKTNSTHKSFNQDFCGDLFKKNTRVAKSIQNICQTSQTGLKFGVHVTQVAQDLNTKSSCTFRTNVRQHCVSCWQITTLESFRSCSYFVVSLRTAAVAHSTSNECTLNCVKVSLV